MINDQLYPQDLTVISKGVKLIGNIQLDVTSNLCGTFNGNINVVNNAKITIEDSANVTGNISGHQIDIFGVCKGEISSDSIVIFHENSHFTGALKCKDFIIKPGAIVNITKM